MPHVQKRPKLSGSSLDEMCHEQIEAVPHRSDADSSTESTRVPSRIHSPYFVSYRSYGKFSQNVPRSKRVAPKSFVGNVSAGIVLPESFAEARSVTRLGDFPLIVLTASHSILEIQKIGRLAVSTIK